MLHAQRVDPNSGGGDNQAKPMHAANSSTPYDYGEQIDRQRSLQANTTELGLFLMFGHELSHADIRE